MFAAKMFATPAATKQPMRFVTKWKSLAIQASGSLLMALGGLVAISTRRNRSPSSWMARWKRQHEVAPGICGASDASLLLSRLFANGRVVGYFETHHFPHPLSLRFR